MFLLPCCHAIVESDQNVEIDEIDVTGETGETGETDESVGEVGRLPLLL
jgi:hypothetical protein